MDLFKKKMQYFVLQTIQGMNSVRGSLPPAQGQGVLGAWPLQVALGPVLLTQAISMGCRQATRGTQWTGDRQGGTTS